MNIILLNVNSNVTSSTFKNVNQSAGKDQDTESKKG